VQGLLGHAHTRYTQRYAHLTPDTLLEAAEAVGDVMVRAGLAVAPSPAPPDNPASVYGPS
jgi:hypothetical protein